MRSTRRCSSAARRSGERPPANRKASSAASPTARTISSTAWCSAPTLDFSFTDIKASQTFNATVGGVPFTANASQKLTWFGTTKLRGGVLVSDNILLYATGGLASGRIEANASNVVNLAGGCMLAGACPFGGIYKNKWGWAAGGGVEVASGPWQFRAEYLHYDLGTVNIMMRDLVVPAGVDRRLGQGRRRHGARRDHLPLQLDAARPDLRDRPHLALDIRVAKGKAAHSAVSKSGYRFCVRPRSRSKSGARSGRLTGSHSA